ncbi:MAG TPA: class I SAM-dependent methyltransferase [Nitrososphaeraceae archaeon]
MFLLRQALSQIILDNASPHSVLGIDSSEEYIAFARKQIQDPRAAFQLGYAQALPVELAAYDVVVSALFLNFVPQPIQALCEMIRAVRMGGTVAAYIWDYAGQMQPIRHFWDAAVALDAAACTLDEGHRFPLCQPERICQLFHTHANQIGKVELRSIDVETTFGDFDDFWSPFLGGQGPPLAIPCRFRKKRRVALREHIRAKLPIAPDGSIHLVARAWAVRGERKKKS